MYFGAQYCTERHGRESVCTCHKDTQTYIQALRQLLIPQLYTYTDALDVILRAELSDASTAVDTDGIAHLVKKLTSVKFQQPI